MMFIIIVQNGNVILGMLAQRGHNWYFLPLKWTDTLCYAITPVTENQNRVSTQINYSILTRDLIQVIENKSFPHALKLLRLCATHISNYKAIVNSLLMPTRLSWKKDTLGIDGSHPGRLHFMDICIKDGHKTPSVDDPAFNCLNIVINLLRHFLIKIRTMIKIFWLNRGGL